MLSDVTTNVAFGMGLTAPDTAAALIWTQPDPLTSVEAKPCDNQTQKLRCREDVELDEAVDGGWLFASGGSVNPRQLMVNRRWLACN